MNRYTSLYNAIRDFLFTVLVVLSYTNSQILHLLSMEQTEVDSSMKHITYLIVIL